LTAVELQRENEELRRQLADAEDALRAIHEGQVDAIVVEGAAGAQVFSLSGAETAYRLAVETMAEAAINVTTDGTILFCNARFSEMTATPLEELLGCDLADFVLPEDRSGLRTLLQRCAREPVKERVVFRDKDDAPTAALLTGSALRQGDAVSLCLVATDLTELESYAHQIERLREHQRDLMLTQDKLRESRRAALTMMEDAQAARREAERAADALRESEEKLRNAFAHAAIGFALSTPDGRFVHVNPAYCTLTGYTAEELHTLERRRLVHPNDYAESMRLTERMLSGQIADFVMENRYVRKNGGDVWVRESVSLVRTPEGSPRWLIALVEDITQRKHVMEELRRLNETLEQRILERTRMHKLLTDVAEAANEAESVEQVLEYALRRVSEDHGWCYGHAYLVEEGDSGALVRARAVYESHPARLNGLSADGLGMRLWPGQGLAGRSVAKGRVRWSNDLAAELAARQPSVDHKVGSAWGAAFPILAGSEVVGVMEFFSDQRVAATKPLLAALASIGTQVGRVVERQRFERDLARALLKEQQRVGQDLHDTVGQEIAGLALVADGIARRARNGAATDPAELLDLSRGLRQALEDLRTVVRGLLPPVAERTVDFAAALQALAVTTAQRHRLACELDADYLVIDSPDVAIQLYRIAAEAVTNAVKHAHAHRIDIRLARNDGHLVLEVADDGRGIPEELNSQGSGLRIMRYRAKLIGAELSIRRRAAGGTAVTCSLPGERVWAASDGVT